MEMARMVARGSTVRLSTRARVARGAAIAVAVAVAVAVTLGCAPSGGPASAPPVAEAGPAGFDAATRDDVEFNRVFRHEFADVEGVRMHYVTGGSGPPLVLLHGWPQSWYSWRGIMPALAEQHTVYALDLPGLGDSDGAPPGYDKATRYAHLDYPLPGPGLSAAQYESFSWHIAFHDQNTFPEAVVADDVREYLALFYPYVARGGTSFGGPGAESPFTDAQVDEFARTYSRPQVLTGGFELYRTLEQDERDNVAAAPIAVPTMPMTAEGLLASARPTVEPRIARITRAVEVPGAGHWLMTESPEFVTAELLAFLGD